MVVAGVGHRAGCRGEGIGLTHGDVSARARRRGSDRQWLGRCALPGRRSDRGHRGAPAGRGRGGAALPAGRRSGPSRLRPLADVRVLIVGQDPYPTPGHPIGLSFAVDAHVRPLPRSLANIYRELDDDLGIPPASHGDLSAWSDRGVMLLNRVLTVSPGAPSLQPGAQLDLAWRARLAPWLGVGGCHGARDSHAGSTRPPPCRHPVGEGCRGPALAAGIDSDHRVAASLAPVCKPRILRIATLFPCQRAARAAGRGSDRLARGTVGVG